MAKAPRKKADLASKPIDDSMRKCCFTVPPRLDQLISAEAKRRKISRSRLLADLLADHFKGARICWPGESDGQSEAVATDPRAKMAG